MPRYRLVVEYAGTPFVGWQRQADLSSVQKALEDAFFALCQQSVLVYGSGRTDAGVHALGQVCHVDCAKEMPPEKLQGALNAHLKPLPVSVLDVVVVSGTFHARFDAIERTYAYLILNRRAPSALRAQRLWHVPNVLDCEAMESAAQFLLGTHDFTTFRAAECQARSPVKTLDVIEISREDSVIKVVLKARSFLHAQVRSIVGSLKLVGSGKWHPKDLKAALEAKDRKACGPVAPAHGLYLVHVRYESVLY